MLLLNVNYEYAYSSILRVEHSILNSIFLPVASERCSPIEVIIGYEAKPDGH